MVECQRREEEERVDTCHIRGGKGEEKSVNLVSLTAHYRLALLSPVRPQHFSSVVCTHNELLLHNITFMAAVDAGNSSFLEPV